MRVCIITISGSAGKMALNSSQSLEKLFLGCSQKYYVAGIMFSLVNRYEKCTVLALNMPTVGTREVKHQLEYISIG